MKFCVFITAAAASTTGVSAFSPSINVSGKVASVSSSTSAAAAAAAGRNLSKLNSSKKDVSEKATTPRRSFLDQVAVSAGLVAASAPVGFFGIVDHGTDCDCGDCAGAAAHGPGSANHESGCNCANCASHGVGCQCSSCFRYGPSPAMAADIPNSKEEDSSVRSPDFYAQTIQMRETNARLEASGYKLDTRAEEEAKMKAGFASFSYDANSSQSGQKGKNVGRGYGRNDNK